MPYVDFKYTSLFWKLGFVEETSDNFVKKYSDSYQINIEAERQEINYGNNFRINNSTPTNLYEHKDFVVLECVNRLLEKGYFRTDLQLINDADKVEMPDIIVCDNLGNKYFAIDCRQWGKDFEKEFANFKKGNSRLLSYYKNFKEVKYLCLYTSRLDGGLLELKNPIISTSNIDNKIEFFFSGIFEDNIKPHNALLSFSEQERNQKFSKMDKEASEIHDIGDYQIEEGVLIKYSANSKNIIIPSNIINIGTGAFWNSTSLVSVEIPNGVKSIGGDAFYYCSNLKYVNIPRSVEAIGNDPFAGCPLVSLTNDSSNFFLEDGVLYDKANTNIIHYPINNSSTYFIIPNGIKYIGKHTFYDCSNLISVTIPKSVICIENNVFAGCKNLKLINNSPNFILENGVLYNKEKTQLIALIDYELETLVIPESVKTIGKNSFWNCLNLKSLTISNSVTRIGYNPFAGCNFLVLKNNSPHFTLKNDVLYNKEKTEIIYCPNTSISKTISIPSSVTSIGRNSFAYCVNLEDLVVPTNVTIIDRGAFSGCINLSSITIPESVKFIGKWAFGHCKSLKTIKISKNTVIEDFAFAECQVKLTLLA